MKKEYQILALFLGIIVISGAIIFASFKAPKPADKHVDEATQESPMQAGPDSTQMMEHVKIFEDQLKGDPNNYDALVGLGNAYYDLNSPDKAIEYYERALKINSSDAGVVVDLGAMYRQAGKFDRAIELFNRAVELNPKLPQAYFNLGMVLHMEKHDRAGAVQAWKKYLELDPTSQMKQFLEEQIKAFEDSVKG